MTRKRLFGIFVATAALAVAIAACTSPAATPTVAPTKAPAAPTTAPSKAAEPTKPAAAPTAAPTKAPEATKPAAAPAKSTAGNPPKPADFPKQPITMVVPWDAGGATDVSFRILAPAMEKYVGTTINVVNKPGAGSQVGVTEVAKAKPDGYTITNTSAPSLITVYLDPDRQASFTWDSLAAIGMFVIDVNVIAVEANSKYKTLKDLVDDARANPEKLKTGDSGLLGDDHLAIIRLEQMSGAKFAQVHFTGAAPEVTALLGGHIDVAFDHVATFGPLQKQGKTRMLAVMDNKRNKFQPDIPTAEEQGFKLYNSSSRGMSAPKGTPKEVVWWISSAMEKAMQEPDLLKRMDDVNVEVRYMNPDDFDKEWRSQEEVIKPILKAVKEQQKK